MIFSNIFIDQKHLYRFVILLSVIKCTTPLPFIPDPTPIWILGIISLLTYCLLKDKKIKVSIPLWLFCIVVLLGLLINQPPIYYRSLERFAAFAINIAFLSPLITTPLLSKTRKIMLRIALVSLRIIVVCSFIAYLLGINLFKNAVANDVYWGFSGITSQSMILAPICAISLLESIWHFLYVDNTQVKKRLWLSLIIMSIWTMFAAGSRGSILAALFALIPLIYYYNMKQKLYIHIAIAAIIALIALPSELYDKMTYSISRKQLSAKRQNSMTSSRDEKWIARFDEFKSSPLLGVGFATQTKLTSDDNMQWIKKTGGLEPGSSWLAILAMTGGLGLICILWFNLKLYFDLTTRCKEHVNAIFLLSILLFFIIHGIVEAWILYSGSFIFFLYWLLVGNIRDNNNFRINQSE